VSSDASAIDDICSRLSAAPVPASPASSDEWQRLAEWWQRMGSSQDVVDAWLSPQGDDLADGVAVAERAIDAGANLLIAHLPDDESTRARALIGVLCHRDAAAVTYQSHGMTDTQWALQCGHTRDHISAWLAMRGEPMALLQIAGDDGVTTMVGCLLAAAARRTPVILEGIRVLAAAVVADRLAPQASSWWRAASTSPDPAHTIASERIDLERGLPLNISTSDSHASRATLALLREVTDNERDFA
jgi:nicotinate-nucleotide--dimethylbenzimidazole phosphoribosyltransferase